MESNKIHAARSMFHVAGFTIVEILVVVGIIGLFLGLSIPQLRSFGQGAKLQNTGKEVVAALRLAQSKTLASEGALQYGVYFNVPGQYILFEGTSYATRNVGNDVIVVLEKTVEVSSVALGGGNEVVFSRLTGQASAQGSITFRLVKDISSTKVVSVLLSGAIQEGSVTSPLDGGRVVDSRHVEVVYQGRDIDTVNESVSLLFPGITFSFPVAGNMMEGEIFWEGDVVSESETQHIKVHTLLLNDPLQGTIFSLHRDRDKNTKSLQVELTGDATGNLISYDGAGVIIQGTSIYAGAPEIQ
ncbi:MAG: hypothetical protein O3C23_01140 [bacterium]|nr:hypothetical protein [bacterium]